MTKSKFLFTAILATMISAGAWAYAPGDTTADGSTAVGTGAHDVYEDAPTDAEAGAGIAGVTYVNRVANRAGAAAQAAENHAAHASASASAAQTSADSAAGAASAASEAAADAASAAEVAKNITAGDGIVVTDKKDDNNNVVGKEIAVKPGKGIEIDKDDGTVAVTPGVGIMIKDDQVSVNTGEGLRYNNDGAVAVNPGAGLTFDEQNALTTNLVAGDNVSLETDKTTGEITINATAGDTILDNTTNHTLSNINAGEGIEIDQNGSNNEITDITVNVAPATAETLGGLFAPASLADAQKSLEEIGSRGKDIYEPDNQALIAVTYPLAVELAAQGQLSGAYPTIADANADFNDVDKRGEMQLRPLSAWAALEGAAAERAAIMALSDESYVNMPLLKNTEQANHSVGDVARPVYVADSVSDDGKHSGVVTPIESVAVPVGANNFKGATSTAKIWIQ